MDFDKVSLKSSVNKIECYSIREEIPEKLEVKKLVDNYMSKLQSKLYRYS